MESIIQSHTIVLLIFNKMDPHLAFSLHSRLVLDPTTVIPFLCWTARNFIMIVKVGIKQEVKGGLEGMKKLGENCINRKELWKLWRGDTFPYQPNTEKSDCRSGGLILPESEWSSMPNVFPYLCQHWGCQPWDWRVARAGVDWGLVTLVITVRSWTEFGEWGSAG